jgi:prepilin-type N-terminal cleavage/methylation domain-containing protein
VKGSIRSSRSRAAGFSLVELMVALAVGGLLLLAVTQILLRLEGSWDRSQARATAERNTRGAMYMMIRDIRMAGTGYGGRPLATGGVPGNRLYPVIPAHGTDSDTLHIVAGLGGVQSTTTQVVGSPSDLIFVADASGFAVGDFIALTNGVDVNLFRVTGATAATGQLEHSTDSSYNDPTGHTTWPTAGYPSGSRVVQVQLISYWLDSSTPQRPLLRRINDGTPIPVASGVDHLEVRYRMTDGSLSSSPANPADIHSVELRYLPHRQIGAAPSDTVAVTVQPRVLG